MYTMPSLPKTENCVLCRTEDFVLDEVYSFSFWKGWMVCTVTNIISKKFIQFDIGRGREREFFLFIVILFLKKIFHIVMDPIIDFSFLVMRR